MKVVKYLAALAMMWSLTYLLGAFFATTFDITQWYEGTRFFVTATCAAFIFGCLPIVVEM